MNLEAMFLLLDRASVVVGLLVSIPVVWTCYEVVFGQKKRQRRWLRDVRKNPGSRPAVLIVDFLEGKNVRSAVEKYLATHEGLKDIPKDRIFSVDWEKHLVPDDITDVIAKIRNEAAKILSSSPDVLHYFYAGPGVTSAMVGAEFSNTSFNVIVYQLDSQTKEYVNYGVLRPML